MKTIPATIIEHCEPYETLPSMAEGQVSAWSAFMGRSLRSGAASIFDQAVVSAANFATMLIIARLCSKEEVGIYYLAWTMVLFIMALQGSLISVPYTMYCCRREGHSLASYAGSTLVHQLITSLAAMSAIWAMTVVLSWGVGPQAMRAVGWVLIVTIPFILMREFIRRFMFAHLELGAAIVLDVSVASVQLASLLLLGYFHLLTVSAVYAVMGGACVLSLLIWRLTNHQHIHFQAERFVADWRENWQFGKWAFISQLIGLYFYILPWLLTLAHNEADTGMFAASNTLVGLANPFVLGMCNFLTPKAAQAFAREGSQGLSRVLRKTTILFTASLGSFCLLAIVAGNYLALLVYGAKYHDAGPIIAVLSIALLLDALGLAANNGLWAIDRPAANFPADIAQSIVSLGTALWLVFPLGAMGIAIAIAVGRGAGAMLRWIALWSTMNSAACPAEAAE